MPNIKFNYLYRDCGNYKNFGSVVFDNPDKIGLKELESQIRSKLIDGEWFYASEWKLPELFFDSFNYSIDPTWHEFESLEYTNEAADSPVELAELLLLIAKI